MTKFLKSVVYASNGIVKAYRQQRNLKVMAVVSILTVIFSWVLGLSINQFYIVLLCNAIAHGAELLNTSIEYLCDHIHVGYHKDIEAVKDISAGATLMIVMVCVLIGFMLFAQAILALLR